MFVTSLLIAARLASQTPDTLTPGAHRALEALRAHQAGVTVLIVVKRDTTLLLLTAVLGKRS